MTGDTDIDRLALDQSIEFWDQRHRRLAGRLAGGNTSLDPMANEMLNAVRVGRIIDLIGTMSEPDAPLVLLDAGCGTGWVTRALASYGHRADGIDTSAAAIATCIDAARDDGRDRYSISRLDEWAPPYLYDAVISVDVVFHIMDDDVWAASVLNLASLVRAQGRLLVADHDLEDDHLWSNYQVSRARHRYVTLLAPEGLVYREFSPYRFRDTPVGFHVFDRMA
jgi:2-polyprenyl-3-methyl-5-hydroxy-6-metoxy-1,4-benzoquinol methylase